MSKSMTFGEGVERLSHLEAECRDLRLRIGQHLLALNDHSDAWRHPSNPSAVCRNFFVYVERGEVRIERYKPGLDAEPLWDEDIVSPLPGGRNGAGDSGCEVI